MAARSRRIPRRCCGCWPTRRPTRCAPFRPRACNPCLPPAGSGWSGIMWRLDYPWLLILLPLGWLAYRYLPAYVQRRGALRIPFFESVARTIGQSPQRPGVRRDGWQLALNVLVWALLVLALARPE